MRPSTLGGEGGWCASFQPLPLPLRAQRRLSITGSVSEVDTEIRPRFMLNEPLASLLTLFRLFPNPTARENRGPRTRPRGFADAHPPSALGDPQLCPPGAATKQEADPPRGRDRGPREGGCKDDASAGDGNPMSNKNSYQPVCVSSVFKKTALNCISWSPIKRRTTARRVPPATALGPRVFLRLRPRGGPALARPGSRSPRTRCPAGREGVDRAPLGNRRIAFEDIYKLEKIE